MIVLIVALGLLTGSVLNLCADNLLIGRPPGRPRCTHCGQARPALAWSAVIGYGTRRHRCPSCAAPIPIRQVLVELAAILLYVFVWLRGDAAVTTALHVAYGSILLLVLISDLEHQLIPHVVMVPAILLALIGAFVNPVFDSPTRALLGGAVGLSVTLVLYVFGKLFRQAAGRLRGQPIEQEAFGFGDVTLTTFLGLAVGAPEILLALAIGILSAGLFGTGYLVVRGLLQRRYTLFTAIPYGPFLILGGVTMLYWGRSVMAWYVSR
jgi:prepilin signal peptidase PulO-like enzyme (type II secretory pathway)